jgi:pyridoxal phosphate enzyme (YggS family)
VTRAFTGLDPKRIAARLEDARSAIADAGRDPADVEILVAIKYVPVDELGALAEAGVTVVGENRAQDLIEKQERWGDAFEAWDFIGALQSRKVKDVAPRVRLIHSVASESALRKLEANPAREVLIEVNVAGEDSKAGIDPADLGRFIEECPVPVGGLMCMPPFTDDPERSRPHFARLAALATEHALARLSMGTSQDFAVAAAEGATIVRLGSSLFE